MSLQTMQRGMLVLEGVLKLLLLCLQCGSFLRGL